ncbi:MAG: NusG domain II-containing protein [Mucispirillum sp.]|nr:NusG domain II-containing protein [Mucispirillum sp.]
MFRKIDVIIIIFFLILSIFLIFKPYNYSAKKIMLVVENENFYIPYKDGYFNLFGKVKDIFGSEHSIYKNMEFEIAGGRIRALHSDCANQICVNTSWIENCGDSIICAPNRVAVIIDCSDKDIMRK